MDWVGRILAQENGQFERIVFLGDFFDSFKPAFSAKRICEHLLSLRDTYDCTFLIGNHDLQYYAGGHTANRLSVPRMGSSHPYWCSGYSRTTAEAVARHLPRDFVDACKVAVMRHGHLLSHAGVMPSLLPYTGDDQTSLEVFLGKTCVEAVHTLRMDSTNPLWAAGMARGGSARVPGPLWCDFLDEFEDALPWPQIVGHTARAGGVWKGRSVCLDANQTLYGVLSDEGLDVRTT